MASRKLTKKLINKDTIKEELRLVVGSKTDYITPTGQLYKDYGNGMMFPKKNFINKNNGYLYTTITYPEGQKQRRVHILVAESYIPNTNNYPIVMHKDNNKTNPNVNNLEWGTVQKNTQDSFNDGLQANDKGWYDSQSIHVCMFDENKNLIKKFGSVGEAYRKTGLTKTTILNQCNHNVKTKPRCGYYFRYLSEYDKYGFVL